jgi:hypothetical protein
VRILKKKIGKNLTEHEAQKMGEELRDHGEYHFSSWYKLGVASARIEGGTPHALRESNNLGYVLKGWSVGWNNEISASAATRGLNSKNGRRRLLVMTQDDHEPRDPESPVELGLYELKDEDEWVQVHYADFNTPKDAARAVQTDPEWA